jgi:hypothetical protein
MAAEKFFNSSDSVRVYKIAGNCDVTVYGSYQNNILEENILSIGLLSFSGTEAAASGV